jgi:pimeloyl-ACP methyl ester carboxylesterase
MNSHTTTSDYSCLDRPEVLAFLFHPRPEPGASGTPAPEAEARVPGTSDVLIPVADAAVVGARLHLADPAGPSILFFHGNGEIVADYDDLGPRYNRMGINFLAADYRGYGRSTGRPTVTAMMHDCHAVLAFVGDWIAGHGFSGPLFAMGRSLGSASALELADSHPDRLSGLILESGFACAGPLLQLLGVDPEAIGFREEAGFRHIDKIARCTKPLLIIHAEFDHIIPFSDGRKLFDACPSPQKRLLKIPGADHNSIFMAGLGEYLAAIRETVFSAGGPRSS